MSRISFWYLPAIFSGIPFATEILQEDLAHRVFVHRGFAHRGFLNNIQISHIAVFFCTSQIFFLNTKLFSKAGSSNITKFATLTFFNDLTNSVYSCVLHYVSYMHFHVAIFRNFAILEFSLFFSTFPLSLTSCASSVRSRLLLHKQTGGGREPKFFYMKLNAVKWID